jgi:signal peptidase I
MIPIVSEQSEAHALKCELAAHVLLSYGNLRLKVTGWSMLPSIWPGDVLVIDRVERTQISDGDIVLCRRDRRLIVHRVTNLSLLETSFLVTRGDAMPAPDLPVFERDLLGRVSRIARRGRQIVPRRKLSAAQQAIALLVGRSRTAAKVIIGLHDFLANSPKTSTFKNRVTACQH